MRKYFSLIFLFSIGFVPTSVAQVLPSYVPANGLEGYWSFSGNAQDVSLNANHGTVSNAILTTDRFGKTNSAYAFNGTSARIITSKIPNLNSDYSISAWLNTTSLNRGWGTIIDCRTSTSAGIGLEALESKIYFTISNGVYNLFPTNFLLQANEWVHVVAVHAGTQNLIYINGVLDNTQTYTQNLLPTTEPFVIGDRGVTTSGQGNYFSGKLDDIGVWSRALSPAEITNIFKAPVTANITQSNTTICAGSPITLSVDTSGFSANSSTTLPANLQTGLIAYYPFNGNFTDESGNGQILTNTGGLLIADRFNTANKAYKFSTINDKMVVTNTTIAPQNFSVSLWFKVLTPWTYNTLNLFSIARDSDNIPGGFAIKLDQNDIYGVGKYRFWFQANETGIDVMTTLSFADVNKWNHIVVVKDGTTVNFYLNNALIATGPFTGTLDYTSTLLQIGNKRNVGNEPLGERVLDDISVYNRALSPAEVPQLANPQPQILWSTGATTKSITVNPSTTTTYTVTLTDEGVSTTDSVTVTVDTPLATITPSGPTAIFQGQSVSLTANAGASYLWSNGATTRSINVNTAGAYTVTVTTANGCSATSQPTSVTLALKATIIQSDTTICAGSPITLSVDTTGFTRNVGSATLAPNLQVGMVVYYPFNGNVNDQSGNGHNGTILGATLTADRFGNANRAYLMDGISHSTPKGISSPYIVDNTKPYSYSIWFKSNDANKANQSIINSGIHTAFVLSFNHPYSPNKIMACIGRPTIGWTVCNDSNAWTISDPLNWHHAAVVKNSTSVKYYMDGQLQKTLAIGPNENMGSFDFIMGAISINGGPAWGYETFSGIIDDAIFYDKALSATEVQQLYNPQPQILWSTGATTPSITVNPSTTTTYTVTITDGGVSSTDSVTVTVDTPIATITPSGPTALCAGGSVTLSANTGASYLWSTGATTQSITVTTAGSYTVTVTNATGCSATSVATAVTVNPLPTASITASGPTTFCTGGSVTLTANAASSYLWSTGATTQSITVSTAGNYTVRITNATGCTSVASAASTVVVNTLPTATITASGPTSFCAGGSVTLSANAGSSYLWSNGATTQSITVSTAGSYTVRITNATGCTSVASAASTVVVNAPPTATITASGPTSFCAGGSVTLSANAGSSYLWSNGATTQSITVSTAGSYTVRVTNATGCISTSSSAVSVSVTGALNIPNTFTPNGDGVNDTWEIDQINQYPNCTVTVFNKMGNKVFESVGYTQPWQGKFKENDLPFDVYYYVIDVKCGSLLKGWIALIK